MSVLILTNLWASCFPEFVNMGLLRIIQHEKILNHLSQVSLSYSTEHHMGKCRWLQGYGPDYKHRLIIVEFCSRYSAFLHGGSGCGTSSGNRRIFDPEHLVSSCLIRWEHPPFFLFTEQTFCFKDELGNSIEYGCWKPGCCWINRGALSSALPMMLAWMRIPHGTCRMTSRDFGNIWRLRKAGKCACTHGMLIFVQFDLSGQHEPFY
jgi:hypothetical protein